MNGCEVNQSEIKSFSEILSGLFCFMECVNGGSEYNPTGQVIG